MMYHAISGKSENHEKKMQNLQSLAKPLQSTNHRLSRITTICNGGLNHPASTTLAILRQEGHGRRFPSSIMKQIFLGALSGNGAHLPSTNAAELMMDWS